MGGPKEPYTLSMVRALGVALMLVAVTNTARADEPPHAVFAAPPVTAELACAALPSAEERAFTAELERFARLRTFTELLIAKREQEFEQATERQARLAQLKRELTEREAAMSQREFDAAVALHLKKREFTRELAAAAARAKAAPAGTSNEPSTPSLVPPAVQKPE